MEGNFNLAIKAILDKKDSEIDIASAASVLLKVNRNRILFENIVKRKNVEKLRYELQKIYDFRIRDAAAKEAGELEKQAVSIITKTLPVIEEKEAGELKGLRPDHDSLPDEIKARALENQNNYPRMRKLHEQLKLMVDAKACDRYPFLKELKELDETVRRNWNEYDTFTVPDPNAAPPAAPKNPDNTGDSKQISAARKFLSLNKTKLLKMKDDGNEKGYQSLLAKMQEKLDFLIESKAGVSAEQLESLKLAGLETVK
jgi:hypothetical protein